ncbi:hypothetical protein BDV95DRAFT_566264 [Massariosphaeria phaeospora]|uniref:Rad4 transglutaminase-like domain-containing protein n=1 Tax=Massariosphaeria phaeospora TaxID=100035 RepID=A0A7C8MQA1_9PLEO|nr:hypothetical protein BDV95DRAFT_566264 [Massariosphaeria phaeospora]
MAGGTARLRKSAGESAPRRSTRRGKVSQDDSPVPDVFHDLLYEEQASKAAGPDEDRKLLKKRKTARSTGRRDSSPAVFAEKPAHPPIHPQVRAHPLDAPQAAGALPPQLHHEDSTSSRTRQTIIDSDESDDSDMEWEDALGDGSDSEHQDGAGDAVPDIGDISITIGGDGGGGGEKKNKRQVRRRAITSVDKKRRLDMHKMHILCLLYHVHRRNAWCNDWKVQGILRKLPPPKALANLVPNPEYTQFQASKRFIDGMNELKVFWSKRFSVTARGMYKPRWADADADVRPLSDFDELDTPIDRDDFRKAASSLHGSQDLGAQLFSALLRAIGVEARLVCSLQCLPFASAAQPSTPEKPTVGKNTIVLDPYNNGKSPKPKSSTSSRSKPLSRLEKVLGERHPVLNAGVAPKARKKYQSPYPVYWVEAFNASQQKWVPIDPLATFTVNAPEKLEPPLSFSSNSLVYAVAFEDDYVAKDVTRRYAKAYNAKTRKFRVETTPNGDKWWKGALKFFKRPTVLDRDQVEDAALARKEGAEGVPKNVQDFKGHPIYVLERHLRHNEVIHPRNQVGKVNVGTSMNPKMEPIYRRSDVHMVRSADKWYRLGQDVKGKEQPLKHAKPKKGRRLSVPPDMNEDDQQEEVGAGLYAPFQTEIYVPPPVTRGRVPRNAYGNLDIYVPSMIPSGGTHIRHKLASKAARIVGVDFAEAVTGFSFKGRHGTAVVQGVVVAQEYAEAVEAVLDAMEYAQEEAVNSQRSSEALRMWRRFFLGLRIAQRVNAIEIDGERGPAVNVQAEIAREDKELAEKEFAGGFFPDDRETTDTVAPVARRYEPESLQHDDVGGGFMPDEDGDGEAGGFVPDDDNDGGGFMPEEAGFGSAILAQHQLRPRRSNDFDGGGFFAEEDEDEEDGGGFIRGPSPVTAGPSSRNADPVGRAIPTEDVANLGGGFVPEDEPIPDASSSRLFEAKPEDEDDGATYTQSLVVGQEETGQRPEPSMSEPTAVPDGEASVTGAILALDGEASSPLSSSPSEAGSLPMEDPDDEDADPEWLVEVT